MDLVPWILEILLSPCLLLLGADAMSLKEKDIITLVDVQCGETIVDPTKLTVTSEYNLRGLIKCRGNRHVVMTQIDAAQHVYDVYTEYAGVTDTADTCLFFEKEAGDIFTVTVYAYLMRPATTNSVHTLYHAWTITCAYSDNGEASSMVNQIDTSRVAVEEHFGFYGPILVYNITMMIQDKKQAPAPANIKLGSPIRLVARVDENLVNGTTKVVHCEGTNGPKSYGIIRGGCGDGAIISKSKGFVTSGRQLVGPYFKAFRFSGSVLMTYSCIFVQCTDPDVCDGNSCDFTMKPPLD